MNKTSTKFAVGILTIGMLILANGIALGTTQLQVGNTTTTIPGNNMSNQTTNVTTPMVTTPLPTSYMTPVQTPIQTEIPTETASPIPTTTPKSPGFGYVVAIVGLLSAVYIIGKRRR